MYGLSRRVRPRELPVHSGNEGHYRYEQSGLLKLLDKASIRIDAKSADCVQVNLDVGEGWAGRGYNWY